MQVFSDVDAPPTSIHPHQRNRPRAERSAPAGAADQVAALRNGHVPAHRGLVGFTRIRGHPQSQMILGPRWQPTFVLKFCPVDQVCAHPLCQRQSSSQRIKTSRRRPSFCSAASAAFRRWECCCAPQRSPRCAPSQVRVGAARLHAGLRRLPPRLHRRPGPRHRRRALAPDPAVSGPPRRARGGKRCRCRLSV